MATKKSITSHFNDPFQQPQLEQIPNRPNNNNNMYTVNSSVDKNISSEYQQIQSRILVKWINVQLKPVNECVSCIHSDFKDGKQLLRLLSVITKNPQLKPEKGNMRIHHLSNVTQALNFLKEQWGMNSLPDIASEAILDGDTESTLDIIVFIIIKYQFHPIVLNNVSFSKMKYVNETNIQK